MTQTNVLAKMIQDHGPDVLFDSSQGLDMTNGALHFLRRSARIAASTTRLPGVRDRLPDHVRKDILEQAYDLMDIIGRCQFILVFYKNRSTFNIRIDQDPKLKSTFAELYRNACDRDDSLRKLCLTSVETYAEPDYLTKMQKGEYE